MSYLNTWPTQEKLKGLTWATDEGRHRRVCRRPQSLSRTRLWQCSRQWMLLGPLRAWTRMPGLEHQPAQQVRPWKASAMARSSTRCSAAWNQDASPSPQRTSSCPRCISCDACIQLSSSCSSTESSRPAGCAGNAGSRHARLRRQARESASTGNISQHTRSANYAHTSWSPTHRASSLFPHVSTKHSHMTGKLHAWASFLQPKITWPVWPHVENLDFLGQDARHGHDHPKAVHPARAQIRDM